MQADEGLVKTAAGGVFVRRWAGDGSGRAPILLLHDSLGSVAQWRDFPAALAQATGREVIAYDRPGFGRSEPRHAPPSLDFVREEATRVFPALRDALALGQVVVFGHSVGGAMAVEIAAAHPQACVAVVSESAQAFVEDRTRAGIRAAKDGFEDPVQMARLARWHGARAPWVLAAWTEVWLSPAFASWSLRGSLPRVHCPLLAIHGDQDAFGSLAFPRTIVAGAGGPATMHALAGCGHVPHREREAEVLALVAEFLAPLD